jgi:DNA-binding CsgD family transcriptional regulator/PAS domain-containing protein
MRLHADAELLDLVGDIYDCAIEPDRWTQTLERFARHVGLRSAGIVLKNPSKRDFKIKYGWGGDPQWRARYRETYFALNPAMTAGWFTDIDEPVTCSGFAGQEEWLRCRMYREWMAPQGFLDAAGLNLIKNAVSHAMVSVIRSDEQGWFTDEVMEVLCRLNPHIRRAVVITDLLDARALRDDMLSATLDLLTVGIVLVDANARIVHANHAGLEMLDARAAVRRADDQLSARDPKAAQDLQQAIATAANRNPMDFPKSGIAVPVASAHGADLAAWVLPLDRGLRNELAAPFAASVAVFLRALGDASPFPGELFVKRYGISPAECRVLMMLVQGMSLREAAEALGISQPTAKTHLQRLFQKTGTDRQADLMRLTMSALAPATMHT